MNVYHPWRFDPIPGHGLPLGGFAVALTGLTTLSRTPLDEWAAWGRDLYLTIHHVHKRQTFISPTGFEPPIPAGERPQTHTSDRAARNHSQKPHVKFICSCARDSVPSWPSPSTDLDQSAGSTLLLDTNSISLLLYNHLMCHAGGRAIISVVSHYNWSYKIRFSLWLSNHHTLKVYRGFSVNWEY